MKCTIALFGLVLVCNASEQWVRTDNLAQESLPRLGEMRRGSPRYFRARGRSVDQLNLSERASRPGEEGLA